MAGHWWLWRQHWGDSLGGQDQGGAKGKSQVTPSQRVTAEWHGPPGHNPTKGKMPQVSEATAPNDKCYARKRKGASRRPGAGSRASTEPGGEGAQAVK